MADKKLRPKYLVTRIGDPGSPAPKPVLATDPEDPDSPFVLMPRKDPAAFSVMLAYARNCEPDLAKEIQDWLKIIAAADSVYGTQGERNRKHLRGQMIRLGS